MGRAVVQAVCDDEMSRLAFATARPGSAVVGADAGELAGRSGSDVTITAQGGEADVVVDFSGAAGFDGALQHCVDQQIPLVSGSTGLTEQQQRVLQGACEQIAVLHAANTSFGVAVVTDLVRRATRLLDDDVDVEILEIHHRRKLDAPSGTALSLGAAVSDARGDASEHVGGSPRTAPRARGEIGYASLRGGDVIGEHTVLFAMQDERIEVTHRAGSRRLFATGALRAAHWLYDRPPGRYHMAHLLD